MKTTRILQTIAWLLIAGQTYAQQVQSIIIDLRLKNLPFVVDAAEETTPTFRAYIRENGTPYTTGMTALYGTFYFSTNENGTAGMAVPHTRRGPDYLEWTLTRSQTASNGVYFAQFIVTNSTAKTIQEFVRGTYEILKSPGTTASATWQWNSTNLAHIALGGDLSGEVTNARVTGIRGRPISTNAPATGQILSWNGTYWIPIAVSGVGDMLAATYDTNGIASDIYAYAAGRAAAVSNWVAGQGYLTTYIRSVTAAGLGISRTAVTNAGVVTYTVAVSNAIVSGAANGQTAYGWGNHAGLYRPVTWVPGWADVTNKPATFPPAPHAYTAITNPPWISSYIRSIVSAGAGASVSATTNGGVVTYAVTLTLTDTGATNIIKTACPAITNVVYDPMTRTFTLQGPALGGTGADTVLSNHVNQAFVQNTKTNGIIALATNAVMDFLPSASVADAVWAYKMWDEALGISINGDTRSLTVQSGPTTITTTMQWNATSTDHRGNNATNIGTLQAGLVNTRRFSDFSGPVTQNVYNVQAFGFRPTARTLQRFVGKTQASTCTIDIIESATNAWTYTTNGTFILTTTGVSSTTFGDGTIAADRWAGWKVRQRGATCTNVAWTLQYLGE